MSINNFNNLTTNTSWVQCFIQYICYILSDKKPQSIVMLWMDDLLNRKKKFSTLDCRHTQCILSSYSSWIINKHEHEFMTISCNQCCVCSPLSGMLSIIHIHALIHQRPSLVQLKYLEFIYLFIFSINSQRVSLLLLLSIPKNHQKIFIEFFIILFALWAAGTN